MLFAIRYHTLLKNKKWAHTLIPHTENKFEFRLWWEGYVSSPALYQYKRPSWFLLWFRTSLEANYKVFRENFTRTLKKEVTSDFNSTVVCPRQKRGAHCQGKKERQTHTHRKSRIIAFLLLLLLYPSLRKLFFTCNIFSSCWGTWSQIRQWWNNRHLRVSSWFYMEPNIPVAFALHVQTNYKCSI